MDRRKSLAWALCLGWMGVIFIMSAMPGDVSGAQSGSLAQWVMEIVSTITGDRAEKAVTYSVEFLLRKGAHMAEYAVLFLLYRRALRLCGARRAGTTALLMCVVYAATDEFHQLFVEGRGPSLRDVMIDAAGAMIGWGVICAAEWIRREIKRRNK